MQRDLDPIRNFAARIRLEAVRMIYEAKDGHPGPALSVADILAVLYAKEMNIRPQDPAWEDRDRLILSKGHACPALYAALSERGYFGDEPVEHFELRKLGSRFQGHPVMQKTPGVDMTSGSLGNGVSIGCGMALAAMYQKRAFRTYVILGDGELEEGVVWEGVMAAAKYRLNNLSLFVDHNGWQSGGTLADIGGLSELAGMFRAFGWNALEIDGHDIEQIIWAVKAMRACPDRPTVAIAHCVKGKCLPFMEGDNEWHKRVPTPEQYELACALLGREAK